MTRRLGEWTRSRFTRSAFLLLVLVAAGIAFAQTGEETQRAFGELPLATALAAALLGVIYMVVTMQVWRAVLQDMGSPLTQRAASRLFFVSQLGKYVPGGIWSVLAAAEMGADHEIPRRRSLSVMVVATLISVGTGLALAVACIPFAPPGVADRFDYLLLFLPLFVAALTPPVLNRILEHSLKLMQRPPLEHPVSMRGLLTAGSWSVLAWILVGGHVWLLGTGVGLEPSFTTLALSTGGYALAWTIGFLILVTPAGLGVREAALAAVLASQLDAGAVVVVVVLSRAILTLVDLLMGVASLVVARSASDAA